MYMAYMYLIVGLAQCSSADYILEITISYFLASPPVKVEVEEYNTP